MSRATHRRGSSIAVHALRAGGPSRGTIIVSAQDSLSDAVERLNSSSLRVNQLLRSLAEAVDACNADPSSSRVEEVEAAAKAARVELLRLRNMRDELPQGEKGREIADSHFVNAAKNYSRELLRLRTSVVEDFTASLPSSSSVATMTSQGRQDEMMEGRIQADPAFVRQAKDVAQRTKELERLHAGFQGVQTLVEELNVLVVNQGERLDSVEGHVEDANIYFEAGYKRLSRTKRLKDVIRQKKTLVGAVCGVILIVGVVVLIVLL